MRRSSELAAANAALLALVIFGLGQSIIAGLTDLPMVRAAAREQLPLAALYIALLVAVFQLDEFFIGAPRTRDMRNAPIASCTLFVIAAELASTHYGKHTQLAATALENQAASAYADGRAVYRSARLWLLSIVNGVRRRQHGCMRHRWSDAV